jgi:hypothetical protein
MSIERRKLTLDEFYLSVERILQNQIKENFPYQWDEDFITLKIIKDFRNSFNQIELSGFRNVLRINWEVYKFTGKSEQAFGDIALLVTLKNRGEEDLTGVAYLEAKKRTKNTTRFDSIKIPQLKRIQKNAPRSMMLLYDYDAITQFCVHKDDTVPLGVDYYNENGWLPYTHSVVVPIDLSLSLGKKNSSLYKYSTPFSYQLCFRYFHGFDLEYNEDNVRMTQKFSTTQVYPKYIMTLNIAKDGLESDFQQVNRNFYSVID